MKKIFVKCLNLVDKINFTYIFDAFYKDDFIKKFKIQILVLNVKF